MHRSHAPFRRLAACLTVAGFATSSASAAISYVVGADAGTGPQVRAVDGAGNTVHSFFAYAPSFTGGVRVAAGDVNGDGIADIITGSGPGGGPHIKVFDGQSGAEIRSFFAFSPSFTGGVRVASGDVNNDGFADVVVGADSGGTPQVSVFDGQTGGLLSSFLAYPGAFAGGVRVATGDVNGDGFADIITGAGAGGGPHVKVFSGQSGAELSAFFAFDPGFTGGVDVAAGDLNGDGIADIVTGAGPGAGGHVKVFDGESGDEIDSFLANPAGQSGGVRVAVGDINGDGIADIGVAPDALSAGAFRVFQPGDAGFTTVQAFDPGFTGGIFIGAVIIPAPGGLALLGLSALAATRRHRGR